MQLSVSVHQNNVNISPRFPDIRNLPELAKMRHNVRDWALVEDEAVLHEDHEVEQLKDFRRGLVNGAQHCGIRLCHILKEGDTSALMC